MMENRKSNETLISPLRYPGSKRRLVPYVVRTLEMNDLQPKLLVEPFAGGASVALQLMADGHVEKIGLSERDPLLASFWETVFFDSGWFMDCIQEMEVSVEKWKEYKAAEPKTRRDRAAKCIFLNRTSFSGILTSSAGPIGGWTQESKYKIDCRFYRETIIDRIEKIASYRDRVTFVRNESYEKTIDRIEGQEFEVDDVFFYFDPPFYNKSHRLYSYSFTNSDHHELHKWVSRMRHPWLLSYDPAPEILDLYSGNGTAPKRVDFLYSVAQTSEMTQAEELVITNLSRLP